MTTDLDLQLLIFTDLDGTLLEHGSYSYAPAAEALAQLHIRRIPLILASSKTAAEIAPLHKALNLGDWPAIVENGSGIYDPTSGVSGADSDYQTVRAALDSLPDRLRRSYRGFGDMSVAEVVEATGLPPEGAALAKTRAFSEPGVWSGTAADETAFLEALAQEGIKGRRGGRFLTLSLGRTKADAMTEIIAQLGAETTIALGDAPNDAEMIAGATYGVWIKNDDAPPVPHDPDADQSRIRYTTESGPTGWNTAILQLLQELNHG